jgi:uncharacterized repeat protein (TIGR03803 family)
MKHLIGLSIAQSADGKETKHLGFLRMVCSVLALSTLATIAMSLRALSQTGTSPRATSRYQSTGAAIPPSDLRPRPFHRTMEGAKQSASNLATETVLYSFCTQPSSVGKGYCNDGNQPLAGLFKDSSGNLFGTTLFGGAYTGPDVGGVVFKLDGAGNYSVLHNFCSVINDAGYCTDGSFPNAGLIGDLSGNLYGTTTQGDATNDGLVFKLDSSGYYSVLYNFCSQANCADGGGPYAGLVEDASGDLFGTTYGGGAAGGGTVFRIDSAGNHTVLYSFCSQANCADGGFPLAGLIEDASGNFFGTTLGGGTNRWGAVFKLDSAGNYSTLYSFCSQANCADGSQPTAGVIQDGSGNLYGTTSLGGVNNGGVVFKLDSAGTYTVLYSFCSQTNCTDGETPYAGLIEDSAGNLYGTTYFGGVSVSPDNLGSGVVFKVDGTGGYSVLYNFCSQTNCVDGASPWYAGLIEDASGNLYGTTAYGGTYSEGTVFKLSLGSGAPIGTTTSLALSPASITVGSSEPLVMTTTVAPASGSATPTGSVTFFSGTNQIGTASLNVGVATFNYNPSSLAIGSYSITAIYGGDSTFASSTSPAQTLSVTATPAYTLSVNPRSLTIVAGQSGQGQFTVTPQNGFSSQVSFSCSGLPVEASCNFNPASVTPSGGNAATSTLTITTTASAAAQSAAVFSGRPMFAALLLPGLMVVLGGASRRAGASRGLKVLVLLAVLAGFGGGLSSCGGGSNSSGGSGGAGGNTGTPAGTYTVTVTASASGTGAISQTASLTITITP